MANKTTPPPRAARSAVATAPLANRPRESLERAVRQASIRAAERKLRHADLHEAIQSASPSLATERAKRAGIHARPLASPQPTDVGA
jgi:hypothetical protein